MQNKKVKLMNVRRTLRDRQTARQQTHEEFESNGRISKNLNEILNETRETFQN